MTTPTARFYADLDLHSGSSVVLPDHAARHVQVLRLQPGGLIRLFNGRGAPADPSIQSGLPGQPQEGEFEATVLRMGRSDVEVSIGDFRPTQREAARAVHLLVGMPANERMDWLVEKATELGVASIQPLMTERSVLRLKADRADKKRAHWHGVAAAACEQCGRNRVPLVHEVTTLADWLASSAKKPAAADEPTKLLLSLGPGSRPLAEAAAGSGSLLFLSGPEGGLSPAEENAARASGFAAVSLGPRVLRSETAALAVLAALLC